MEFPTDIDKKIVRMLLQNARQSSEEIAKQLDVTSATIRRRINRLIEDQALRIVALIDPEKFGFPLVAIIAFKVDRDKLDQTIQNLTQCPEIPWVTSTTGRYDVLTMAWFRSNSELSDFLKRVAEENEGIRDSETFICLDMIWC
ncbi:Lrp/AsnC family transcriptional regulator [Thermodesulfobacteriota bacterium]